MDRDLELSGDGGGEFRLILRQNRINPLDFSIILALRVPTSNQIFQLRRYNGTRCAADTNRAITKSRLVYPDHERRERSERRQ